MCCVLLCFFFVCDYLLIIIELSFFFVLSFFLFGINIASCFYRMMIDEITKSNILSLLYRFKKSIYQWFFFIHKSFNQQVVVVQVNINFFFWLKFSFPIKYKSKHAEHIYTHLTSNLIYHHWNIIHIICVCVMWCKELFFP